MMNPSAIDFDISSTYDVWAEALAVNSICVRRGKSGAAIKVGRWQGNLFLGSDS